MIEEYIIDDTKGDSNTLYYQYDAYGQHKVLDGNRNENNSYYFIGNLNPFRYKGYYYDVETKLFSCNSRYYSPELCRFISPDSIEYLDPESINGLNLYCYCMKNPIMYADPSGHFAIWVFLGVVAISAIAGAIDGGVTTAMSGQNFWKGFAAGAIDAGVDIIQTPLYFTSEAQQRIRGTNNKNNRTDSIFANRLTYAY